jgi:hypothetical protein
MKAVTINSLAEIPGLFPFASLAKDGGLIVDIGGGLGQVSRHILSCNSGAGLRCVVQDQHAFTGSLPKPSEEIDIHEEEHEALALEFQQHNFFDLQPVRGTSIRSCSSVCYTDMSILRRSSVFFSPHIPRLVRHGMHKDLEADNSRHAPAAQSHFDLRSNREGQVPFSIISSLRC